VTPLAGLPLRVIVPRTRPVVSANAGEAKIRSDAATHAAMSDHTEWGPLRMHE
jgi:hypothetical protein